MFVSLPLLLWLKPLKISDFKQKQFQRIIAQLQELEKSNPAKGRDKSAITENVRDRSSPL